MSEAYFIGIDVGTGSARAGVFTHDGKLLGSAKRDINLYKDGSTIVEQSSENIWSCVCQSVREALTTSKIPKENIKGIGFDATCSLVVLDKDGRSLSVSVTGENDRNIIVWMDHRATEQADRINMTNHRVLKYVGGKISPEMETPKLLWLKENMPKTYEDVGHFFDLTDYLTWRCSDDFARSICTVTCKWTYMAHENSWDKSYFDKIGLGDLAENSFARIGSRVVDPGTALGAGLTVDAAENLGLVVGTPVAAGLIDAHAGGLGTVGASGASSSSRMAYVFGTSACTMSSSENEAFVPGVWGPYYSAMIPGLWLSEGGQSAAGEAISHLLKLHPAYESLKESAESIGLSLPNYLLTQIDGRVTSASEAVLLAKQIVVVPEFLGNRAPFADPEARAVVSGLDLSTDMESMLGLYVAGILGLGYGLKQILNVQAESGVKPDTVVISGGAGESAIVKQLLSDAANIRIASPGTREPVLLGAAMLGAVAGGWHASLVSSMEAMSTLGDIYSPTKNSLAEKHLMRFKTFEALQKAAMLVREV